MTGRWWGYGEVRTVKEGLGDREVGEEEEEEGN